MRRPDLPISGWLALGLGAAAALLVGVSAAALAGLRGLDAELERQFAVIKPRLDAAVNLQVSVLRLGIAARALALAPSPTRKEALYAAEVSVDRAIRALEALPRERTGGEAYARVPALVESYRGRAHELAVAAPGRVSATETRLREVRETLLPILDAYVGLQQRKLAASAETVVRRREVANALLVGGVAAALALLAALAALVSRAVRRPVHALVALTRRVGAGDYTAAAAIPAGDGRSPPRNELAELAASFGAMARALDDRERRIAAQSEQLRSQNEELQSQNEELQAQAEELQAQAEEIESQQAELQAHNEALRASEDALRDADRRKDEFLAVLSHELRNPLAPIVNGLAILAQAPADGEQARRAREIVARQVRQLVRLVDDLLDVTRIARGKAQLRRADVDLAAVVTHVVEDHRHLLERAGVRLELEVPPGPIPAWADPERLSQVVANLVQNAAKFTPAGGTVQVECTAGDGRATLRVRDDGEGISPDILKRLFVPFVQADGSLARTRGGLGLGLALVKGIVELHGGTVDAASAGPGCGAEFTIQLPLEHAARTDGAGGSPPSPVADSPPPAA